MSDPKHVRMLAAGLTLVSSLVAEFFTPPQAPKPDKPKAQVINLQAYKAAMKRKKS